MCDVYSILRFVRYRLLAFVIVAADYYGSIRIKYDFSRAAISLKPNTRNKSLDTFSLPLV